MSLEAPLRMVLARVIIGIVMMIAGCVGIVVTIKAEGLGCLGAIASGIACLVVTLTIQVLPADELHTFWGMDYFTLSEVAGVLIIVCIVFSATRIAGVIGCFVLFFTGLLTTGLLDASTVELVSHYVGYAGAVVFSPVLVPLALIVVALAVL